MFSSFLAKFIAFLLCFSGIVGLGLYMASDPIGTGLAKLMVCGVIFLVLLALTAHFAVGMNNELGRHGPRIGYNRPRKTPD